MVLCAGLGTRLRPLTHELPKPLVPVGDRPLLAHIAQRLRKAGFDELVVNTHHLPEKFFNLDDVLGIKAHRVHEPRILGTAGGVAGARALFGAPPIVLWNGDIWAEPTVGDLVLAAADGGLALGVAPRPVGEGTVGLDADGCVARLRGERFGVETSGADYIGVAALGRRCLETLPSEGCLIGDWALPELRAGRRIAGVLSSAPFSDAGDPAAYLELNLRWLGEQAFFVGPGASVAAGVQLERSVIGAGVRVEGEGSVLRVVAWPGAVVKAPLHDAIVTAGGVVVSVGQSR